MKTIKLFLWFTVHSWAYLAGDRLTYFTGFIPACREFYALSKND